jgi:hypothetical protein
VDNDSVEGFAFLRASATLAPFSLAGDRYGVTVCTEGESDGAITLQRLAMIQQLSFQPRRVTTTYCPAVTASSWCLFVASTTPKALAIADEVIAEIKSMAPRPMRAVGSSQSEPFGSRRARACQ